MTQPTPPPISLDSLLPPEMAKKAENIGVSKANLGPFRMLALAVLAGAFIALGAIFMTTVTAGASGVLPYGIARLVGGFAFCLGLILVVVAGAELFTGNNLIVMAWASRKVTTGKLLRNWIIVYLGNFVGAILTAYGMYLSGQFAFGQGAVGLQALTIANAKVGLGFTQAVVLGIFCNALVCMAVWLCMSARTTTDRILSILFPISAFVAAGFEHSIANMYFIPMGLALKNHPALAGLLNPAAIEGLTLRGFFLNNLIPVTIGNLIGGVLFVATVYWTVYLRPASAVKKAAAKSGA